MRERELPPCDGKDRDRAGRLISDMLDGEVTSEGQIRSWIAGVKYLPKQCREHVWYELRKFKENKEFSKEAYDELRKIYLAITSRWL